MIGAASPVVADGLTLSELLQIAQLLALLGGCGVVTIKVGRYAQSVDGVVAEIKTLQDDVKALNKIVTEQAVQNVRLDAQDRRFDSQDKRLDEQARLIDDLRRGEGMILPIEPHLGRVKPKP